MPSPRDSFTVLNMGTALKAHLKGLGVETFEHLARVDPYDTRLQGFGGEAARWVNEARAVLADAVIHRVEVGEAVMVRCAQLYEPELLERAVEARLGIHPLFIQVERRRGDVDWELVFRRNLEQPTSLGPWLEYKLNARIYAAHLRAKAAAAHTPQPPSPVAFETLLHWLAPTPAVGDSLLISEALLHALFADRFHLLLVEEQGLLTEAVKEGLRRSGEFLHHVCGSRSTLRELAELLSAGALMVLESWQRATGEERLALGEAMAQGRVLAPLSGEVVEYETPIRVFATLSPGGGLGEGKWSSTRETASDPTLFTPFSAAVLASPLKGEELFAIAEYLAKKGEVTALARYLQAARSLQPSQPPPPTNVLEKVKALYGQWSGRMPAAPLRWLEGLREAAKARARMRLAREVTAVDYEAAAELLQATAQTWFRGEAKERRGRRRVSSQILLK